jgi:acetyltransferase-like isoleucine patch superfamily enzyme
MSLIYNFARYLISVVKKLFRTPFAILRYREVSIARGVVVAGNCEFGENVKIYENSVLSNVSVNDYSYIGGDCRLKNCVVGKFCSVGTEIQIGVGMHPIDKISTYPGFYSSQATGSVRIGQDLSVSEFEEVEIGNDVWIGNRVIVLDGVKIGNGSVIAAGSVVTKNVEPYSIVAGVPARMIKMRFSQGEIDFLQRFKWWDRGLDYCVENADLFNNPERFFERYSEGRASKNASETIDK